MKRTKFLNVYEQILRAPADEGAGATPPAEDSAEGDAAAAAVAAEAANLDTADTGPDLSFIGEDFQTDGKPDTAKFATHYAELVARDAQSRENAAAVPEDGVYTYALPEDFKFAEELGLPADFKVDLLTEDPAMKPLYDDMSAMLKDWGVPAEGAGKAAGLIAKYEAIKMSQAIAAGKAEMQALGTSAQAKTRIDAVSRLIDAKLPAPQAAALKAATTSAAGVQALERLLAPRSMSPAPIPAEEDTSNMTASERLAYANRKAASGG